MLKISNIFGVLILWNASCDAPPSTAVSVNPPAQTQTAKMPVSAKMVAHASENTDYLLGKFDPTIHPDFVLIGKPYSTKTGMYLRKETCEAFVKMHQAAQTESIFLNIISATRPFSRQKEIWEEKWSRFATVAPKPIDRALKILEFSSMPGSSRHHWGTDIDLNDLNNSAFEKGGKHEKVYKWLVDHAHEFGFCQPYTPNRPNGYHAEKWHWTYTPLSAKLLEAYRTQITDAMITGFKGADLATELKIVEHYVCGINESCK